ncbi:MAG TPA: hypothetical protein VN920_02630 [Pyrinomonadaceae bacterium]|nr:hypothetical protein [Pyrinomonadaceae bacterium]
MKGVVSVVVAVLILSLSSNHVFAQSDTDNLRRLEQGDPDNTKWTRPILPWAPFREERALSKGLLAPSPSDRTALAGFLRMPNTGLIRLLPREVCDSQIYHTKSPVNIPGGGAYYSFAHLTHFYGYGSDIELDHNRLSVGFAGADYGMLTILGDVPLEEISKRDPRAQFISSYKPPTPERQARAEAQRFRSRGGVTIDGSNYQMSLPLVENSTYLLRSIAYDHSDVLVAFRVFRKDKDGSAIIAWKLLKRYPTPELKQGK